MSPVFVAALAKPTGQVKIASCAAEEVSFESSLSPQGVFTAGWLHALRGGAADADGSGLIELEEALAAAKARVAVEVAAINRGRFETERQIQSPSYHGPETGRRLPLAIPATDTAALIAALKAKIGGTYPADLHARVAGALSAGAVEPRLRAAAEKFAAGRTDPFTFALVAEALLPEATLTDRLKARVGDDYPAALHARVAAALASGAADPRLPSAVERFADGRLDAFTFGLVANALAPDAATDATAAPAATDMTARTAARPAAEAEPTDLPALAAPPPGPPRTLTVAPDGSGDVRTIGEALKTIADGGTIRVKPAVYKENGLVIDRPVTLEGVGPREKVVIEANASHGLHLTAATATVRGLTVRCTAAPEATKTGVYITAGKPTLSDVAITSQSLACVYIDGEGTAPTLTDCVCEDGEAGGLFVNGGAGGTYERCTFRGNKVAGVEVYGAGTAPTLTDCVSEDGEQAGLLVNGGAGGTYERCTFRGNKVAGVAVQGADTAPTFSDCVCEGSGEGDGLTVNSGAGGTYERCIFRGNKFSGVSVRDVGTAPTLTDCQGLDNGASLFIYAGAGGTFRKCRFRGNKHAGIRAGIMVQDAGTAPTLTGCVSENSREGGGLFVYGGAGGIFEQCTFWGNKLAGVEVQDAGTAPTLTDCTITGNGYEAVWVHDKARATVTGCDLRGNDRGAFFIEPDAGTVTRRDNKEAPTAAAPIPAPPEPPAPVGFEEFFNSPPAPPGF